VADGPKARGRTLGRMAEQADWGGLVGQAGRRRVLRFLLSGAGLSLLAACAPAAPTPAPTQPPTQPAAQTAAQPPTQPGAQTPAQAPTQPPSQATQAPSQAPT